uniref:Uncharacterized protein n=1 Tax=Romanomermis culicivorax TaxID=13658 RepID=A0A915HLC6_ROMCU
MHNVAEPTFRHLAAGYPLFSLPFTPSFVPSLARQIAYDFPQHFLNTLVCHLFLADLSSFGHIAEKLRFLANDIGGTELQSLECQETSLLDQRIEGNDNADNMTLSIRSQL